MLCKAPYSQKQERRIQTENSPISSAKTNSKRKQTGARVRGPAVKRGESEELKQKVSMHPAKVAEVYGAMRRTQAERRRRVTWRARGSEAARSETRGRRNGQSDSASVVVSCESPGLKRLPTTQRERGQGRAATLGPRVLWVWRSWPERHTGRRSGRSQSRRACGRCRTSSQLRAMRWSCGAKR